MQPARTHSRTSPILIMAVIGFCLGLGAIKLAGPFMDFAIGAVLRSHGFDEAAVDTVYTQAGQLTLKHLRLRRGAMVIEGENIVIKNPFFFLWDGPRPSLNGEMLTLSFPLSPLLDKTATPESIFKNFENFAGDMPFEAVQIRQFRLWVLSGQETARWRGTLDLEATAYFLTVQADLRNEAERTLTVGLELSSQDPRGYLWWRRDFADKHTDQWGGLAWDAAQMVSFLQENAEGRTVLRADNQTQALDLIRHTIVTLSPSSATIAADTLLP